MEFGHYFFMFLSWFCHEYTVNLSTLDVFPQLSFIADLVVVNQTGHVAGTILLTYGPAPTVVS
jgi:hypothetical protein